MTREEFIDIVYDQVRDESADKIINAMDELLKQQIANEPILCEDCRHRNTWDNGRLVPQYYRCGRGVKFRDYGYVREDDYCPFGERREP